MAEAPSGRIEWFIEGAPPVVVSHRNVTDPGGPSPRIAPDPSDGSPAPENTFPERDGHLPRPTIVAILLEAVFYPALVLLGGWASFLVTTFLVMMFRVHYLWFPLVFGAPLLGLFRLATLVLHLHLRSSGFPRHGTATALMVCALLAGSAHVWATGTPGLGSDPVRTIATVTVYTLVVAFALILHWSDEPRLRPRWKILAMAGAVAPACVIAWAGTKISYERELDRRVREHVGYDQMSPVDQEILRQRYERE